MATNDRRPYLTATVLNQAFLDECQDNLENRLEMVAEIETTSSTIYASDRNKYIGSRFYEAITQFPVITRTVGDWLNNTVEFSTLQLDLSNVDGRFNNFLPSGADFGGWIGKEVIVKIGLRDVASTYTTIYRGRVTEIAGFQRDREKITLITRDSFDRVNVNFPTTVLTTTSFPDLEDNFIGLGVPVIYGDWTTRYNPKGASIPAFPVNGNNAGVKAGTTALQLIISDNDNIFLDDTNVYIRRSDNWFVFNVADITIGTGNRSLSITQGAGGGTTLIDGVGFQYETGDEFFVRLSGKDLTSYDDNIVWQARDILIEYGGLSSGDFDSNWAIFRDKSSPSESAISNFKSRIWVQEAKPVMDYILSLLEQVRLEVFISRDLKFKISSLHFDDFEASPSFTVKNWDVEMNTFNPQLDDGNVWNRAKAEYSFDPSVGQQFYGTSIYRNSTAITQIGKEISKKIVFPNLYEENTVILQLKEMIKLASGYSEQISMTLTSRAILKDIGDFVLINVKMGSTIFEDVPAMIREIGYDPQGLKVPVKVWSMQMIPFPGYAPGYPGIVGGYTATITEET